jgi:hypothetical protein
MTAAALLALINAAAQLEPVAFQLVAGLITGLKGKSDAEVLAGDAKDWAAIIITAHTELQPKTT